MKTEIAEAIRTQRCVQLFYAPGLRTIEPHALGMSSEGHLLLRAYQIDGASSSGEHVHWKLFRLDRIGQLGVTDVPFNGPRHGYKRGDKAMKGGIIREL